MKPSKILSKRPRVAERFACVTPACKVGSLPGPSRRTGRQLPVTAARKGTSSVNLQLGKGSRSGGDRVLYFLDFVIIRCHMANASHYRKQLSCMLSEVLNFALTWHIAKVIEQRSHHLATWELTDIMLLHQRFSHRIAFDDGFSKWYTLYICLGRNTT